MSGTRNSSSAKRPLSPHLQIYKPQMTSGLSILHRMTGVALAVGTLMLCWWLIAAATSTFAYNVAMRFALTPLGQFMIAGWSFALFYHMTNGVRHLLWDMGYLFRIENATRAGYAVLFISVIATLSVWACAILFR